MPMEKQFDPTKYEDALYAAWEQSGFFTPEQLPGSASRAPFSVMMPPPNVTGVLHLGHALENTLLDSKVRFERMRGKRALLLPGTDHAAVATQAKVEDLLKRGEFEWPLGSGKFEQYDHPRSALGRDALLERIRGYAEQSKATILKQVRKMGTSADWTRLAYTFDEERSEAVTELFARMYNDGLIYRGYRVVNWSVVGQSTCSDDELVYVEREATLYTFKYSADFPIAIATTRPETKLGDTAVAVHPDDARYQQYIGQQFTVDVGANQPLKITVIADEGIDPTFGTGALGVTPAHSQTDYEMYLNHKEIGMIPVIGFDGRMLPAAGEAYTGLSVEEAREKFVAWLKEQGLMISEETISQNVSTSDRFRDIVEALPMEQWFVAVDKEIRGRNKTLKQLMLDAVTTGHVRANGERRDPIEIVPDRFHKIYTHWIENLRDWNISRQIWWGHRIPAWHRAITAKQKESAYVMGFHEDVVPQLFQGKTTTYRLRDHGIVSGQSIAFQNSQTGAIVGYGSLLDVEQTTAGEVPLDDVTHGTQYEDRNELYMALRSHHPEMPVGPDTPVWVYHYTFVPLRNNTETEIAVQQQMPQGEGWQQDDDTLDTWFSSAAWTFSTLGWPQNAPTHKNIHSDIELYHNGGTNWMQMGHEILFFWMARMILMTTYALDDVPFQRVYIHGILRDKEGKKFSKSSGNGIDPIEVIQEYGADALRMSLIENTSPGNDARFYEDKVVKARNFVTKLWNISRFIAERAPQPPEHIDFAALSFADQMILTALQRVIAEVTDDFEHDRFGLVPAKLYDFVWNDFAAWYIEEAKQEGSQCVMQHTVLETVLRLLHPVLPFVTEQIAKELGYVHAEGFVMVQEWPHQNPEWVINDVYATVHETIAELLKQREIEKQKEQLSPEQEAEIAQRQREELEKAIAILESRLANEAYIAKAPAHLVQQTREELEEKRAQRAKM